MSGEVKSKKIIYTFFFFFLWRILLSYSKFQHVISFLIFALQWEISEEIIITLKLPEGIIFTIYLTETLQRFPVPLLR